MKHKASPVTIICLIASVLCLLLGLYFLLKEPIKAKAREERVENNIAAMEEAFQHPKGENSTEVTLVVYPDEFEAIEGEFDGMTEEEIQAELSGPQTLRGLGILSIPARNIKLPVWETATVLALRHGGAHGVDTALPGQVGNCTILAHHMRHSDTMFHYLDQCQLGDIIHFDALYGPADNYFEYEVDEIRVVTATELLDYMVRDIDDTARITLVTCTYTPEGKKRLLVRGTLVYSNHPNWERHWIGGED